MPAEQNKAIVRRFFEEMCNLRNFAVADEIFAPEFKMFPDSQPPFGADGVKGFMAWFTGVFPDVMATIDSIICEDDTVAIRVTLRATQTNPINWIQGFGNIEPTGKPFELIEYQFWRVTDGKLAERWVCFDTLRMLSQLGVVG